MADKDAINKLYMERTSKLEQENIKLRKQAKKFYTKLQQTKTELEEARDGAVTFVEENSQAAIEQYKKRLEFQDFINNYVVGAFNMACQDMRGYHSVKHPSINKLVIDVIYKAFNKGEELELTSV